MKKRPSWFKMFLSQKALIDSVTDEEAGQAIKAVYRYFDSGFETGEIPGNLSPMVFSVFMCLKPYIDESFEEYRMSVENGLRGANARWGE